MRATVGLVFCQLEGTPHPSTATPSTTRTLVPHPQGEYTVSSVPSKIRLYSNDILYDILLKSINLCILCVTGRMVPHPQGEYTVSSRGTQTMLNSLMYKMSYHDFGNIMTENGKGTGYDRVRQYEIGNKDTKLDHLYEVGRGWLGVVRGRRLVQSAW